jgi:hypothetical protein
MVRNSGNAVAVVDFLEHVSACVVVASYKAGDYSTGNAQMNATWQIGLGVVAVLSGVLIGVYLPNRNKPSDVWNDPIVENDGPFSGLSRVDEDSVVRRFKYASTDCATLRPCPE